MRFTKNHNIMITRVFEHNLTLSVPRCSRIYSLMVFSKSMKMSQVCIVIFRFFVKRPPVFDVNAGQSNNIEHSIFKRFVKFL